MIKKLILAALIAVPSMMSAQKFGIIDTNTLMGELPEVKEVQTQMEASIKKYQDEENNLRGEYEKKVKELQAMDQNTPEAIQKRRIEELQSLEQKINEFRQTASQDLQRQQEQLLAPIRQQIVNAIQAVGAEGNYTMIFESGSELYHGNDVENLTAKVKAKLGK